MTTKTLEQLHAELGKYLTNKSPAIALDVQGSVTLDELLGTLTQINGCLPAQTQQPVQQNTGYQPRVQQKSIILNREIQKLKNLGFSQKEVVTALKSSKTTVSRHWHTVL